MCFSPIPPERFRAPQAARSALEKGLEMNAVTGATRRLSSGELDVIQAILEAVDQRGRAMDEKWGCGRLPTLVSLDWVERFASQKRKMSAAVWAWDCAEVRKHGEAMVRAYEKLDQLAIEAGHVPGPPEQWEFTTDQGLVILVQDRSRMNQAQTHGRRCQVWSIDEIAEVIRKHPILARAKEEFPGAEIVSVRVAREVKDQLNDSLEGLPL